MLKQTNIKLKRRALLAGVIAAAVTAIVPAAKTSAYGPDRDYYTADNPADHALFNSICYGQVSEDKKSCTIDPDGVIGSEMDFVRVREKGSDTWLDEVNVEPGKDYEVWVYYHNNASPTYNSSEYHGVGIAQDVRLYSNFDKVVSANQNATVTGIINWKTSEGNAPESPFEDGVWDEAYFKTTSERDIKLTYVNDSAEYHTDKRWGTNGMKVPTALFEFDDNAYYEVDGKGLKAGSFKLGLGITAQANGEEVTVGNGYDGIIPGCDEYLGYITYTVHADQPNSTFNKRVSKDGTNWVEEIRDAKPGDTIYYKIEWCNTGTLTQNDVTFKDELPQYTSLISKSTKVKKDGYDEVTDETDSLYSAGLNAGTFAPNECVTVTYATKIDDGIGDSKDCEKDLWNTAHVYDDNGGDTSKVKVSLDIDCSVPELPKTGPGEIALSLVAVICVTVGIIYWYYSQKELAAFEKETANAAPKATKSEHSEKAHKDDK